MRGRIIIATLAATLVVAGSSVALGAATQSKAPASTAAGSFHPQPLPPSLAKADATLAKVSKYRVRCRNLACINTALTDIAGAVKHLNKCIGYIRVARYPGYLYSNGSNTFQTTALDEAGRGEKAPKMAILTC